jgi:hypothetical protein
MRFCFTLLAIICLVAAKPTPPPLGTLAGTVKSNNTPVRDATVQVWQGKKAVGTARVDEKGDFRLPLADGTYEVQAGAPQFRPAIPMRITVVVHAQRETWVNLELVPGS